MLHYNPQHVLYLVNLHQF